ncbi:hypothetical protein [Thalassobius sp. Cn5-15]|uniref:hypothetical protein n=1 Tax=Thalassobius sp. Cn5-15 TaxID=2917763 RepID=UPI001EF3AE08|nr:hypothetical protein [Thalassobius sp. Cn5-15]MCG7492949.1 hypothetical protein [Thalassobius sp. Cn5-15]
MENTIPSETQPMPKDGPVELNTAPEATSECNEPGTSPVCRYLYNYYMEHEVQWDVEFGAHIYWAWRAAFDEYVDYGVVKDSFDDHVVSQALKNLDETETDLSPEQEALAREYLETEMDRFPGVAGLAMMAAAYDLERRLLTFVKDLKASEATVN